MHSSNICKALRKSISFTNNINKSSRLYTQSNHHSFRNYQTKILNYSPILSTSNINSASIFKPVSSLYNLNHCRNNYSSSYSSSSSSSSNNQQHQEQQQEQKEEHKSNNNNNESSNKFKRTLFYASGTSIALFIAMSSMNTSGNNNNNNNNGSFIERILSRFKITEGTLTIASIIALNGAIFLLLKNPAFFNRYSNHFFCSVHNISSHPMCLLLSNFTHIEGFHFLFNMVGLWSFGQVAYEYMGMLPFLALYVGGGLMGTLTSVTHKLITRGFNIPSIGASGCVLAVVAASILFEPNNRVSIIFLPFLSFESHTMLYALIAFDLAGVLGLGRFTNWDHSCHLGSTLAGAILADSYRYKANFQNFQGQGTTSVKNLSTYSGHFSNGLYNGSGVLHNIPNNEVFKGLFKDGTFVSGELRRNGKSYSVQRVVS
ncbi:hypothetical protein PPL_08712 [Heterostelium album PN500]|uniref:Peptidase S54 rhomboid domain-containing protein n=1 Tax=Heterostelium pallidum (strain ATCC 26659 / Pp 5 / PN500) TaxID=670386 RepID=D3BJI6_HETP5|nr:hypothetical protein PPL_08712 [Heterostelium album PN500]EFA78066.1 hypothetical protein PPL_08712 [Heterostelium album PN500]|eukprot:XP_020430193.1 hypothetical protein PPL_08712 [Heterostelium album PN500]